MSAFSKKKDVGLALDSIIEQVLAEVPNREDPNGPFAEVHKLIRRRNDLETQRRAILAELSRCSSDGVMGPNSAIRYNSEADTQAVVDGADVSTLTSPAEESRRGGLMRQLRAVENGPGILQSKIQVLMFKIIHEQFQKLRPKIREVITDIVRRYEDLLTGLQSLQRLEEELNRRGLDPESRERLFLGIDGAILGGIGGFPSLAWHVSDRRKVWGLDEKEK